MQQISDYVRQQFLAVAVPHDQPNIALHHSQADYPEHPGHAAASHVMNMGCQPGVTSNAALQGACLHRQSYDTPPMHAARSAVPPPGRHLYVGQTHPFAQQQHLGGQPAAAQPQQIRPVNLSILNPSPNTNIASSSRGYASLPAQERQSAPSCNPQADLLLSPGQDQHLLPDPASAAAAAANVPVVSGQGSAYHQHPQLTGVSLTPVLPLLTSDHMQHLHHSIEQQRPGVSSVALSGLPQTMHLAVSAAQSQQWQQQQQQQQQPPSCVPMRTSPMSTTTMTAQLPASVPPDVPKSHHSLHELVPSLTLVEQQQGLPDAEQALLVSAAAEPSTQDAGPSAPGQLLMHSMQSAMLSHGRQHHSLPHSAPSHASEPRQARPGSKHVVKGSLHGSEVPPQASPSASIHRPGFSLLLQAVEQGQPTAASSTHAAALPLAASVQAAEAPSPAAGSMVATTGVSAQD